MMRLSSPRTSLVVWLLVMVGCDATIASNDEVADTGDASSTGSSFAPCSDDAPCPADETCFNGTCVVGCTSNAECGESQFCDDTQLCQSEQVATCSDDEDCVAGQVCIEQVCSTQTSDSDCTPYALTMDGCPSNALCLAEDETSQACYTMPACSEDDTCPVGIQGAVCNVDYVPDKDEICMIGVCASIEHCPTDWKCVRFAANDPLGVCGSGTFGSPCASELDCLSGVCFALPGLIGFCQ